MNKLVFLSVKSLLNTIRSRDCFDSRSLHHGVDPAVVRSLTEQLRQLTVSQLKQLCVDCGLRKISKLRKESLIKLLIEHRTNPLHQYLFAFAPILGLVMLMAIY